MRSMVEGPIHDVFGTALSARQTRMFASHASFAGS